MTGIGARPNLAYSCPDLRKIGQESSVVLVTREERTRKAASSAAAPTYRLGIEVLLYIRYDDMKAPAT